VDYSVVIPVYKEELNIVTFLKRLVPVLEKLSLKTEIIFILDPSPDRTEEIIIESSRTNPGIKLIKMSRRFGQPAATMAGSVISIPW
jgi:dolichol-phosphate mannosyltransferase